MLQHDPISYTRVATNESTETGNSIHSKMHLYRRLFAMHIIIQPFIMISNMFGIHRMIVSVDCNIKSTKHVRYPKNDVSLVIFNLYFDVATISFIWCR